PALQHRRVLYDPAVAVGCLAVCGHVCAAGQLLVAAAAEPPAVTGFSVAQGVSAPLAAVEAVDDHFLVRALSRGPAVALCLLDSDAMAAELGDERGRGIVQVFQGVFEASRFVMDLPQKMRLLHRALDAVLDTRTFQPERVLRRGPHHACDG